jgi:hypothetical protein
MKFCCKGCNKSHKVIRCQKHRDAELVMAPWYSDASGLHHYVAVCLVCGEVHDVTGSWTAIIGSPFKAVDSFHASGLITALLELGDGRSLRDFLGDAFRLPDQIIDALMQSNHLPSDIPKQRPPSLTPYLRKLEGNSDWFSNNFSKGVAAIQENISWVLLEEAESPLQLTLFQFFEAAKPIKSLNLKLVLNNLGGVENQWARRKSTEAIQSLDAQLTTAFRPGKDIAEVTIKVADLGLEYLQRTAYIDRNHSGKSISASTAPSLICSLFIRDILFVGDISEDVRLVRDRLFPEFLVSLYRNN